jgi:hypothetical protein
LVSHQALSIYSEGGKVWSTKTVIIVYIADRSNSGTVYHTTGELVMSDKRVVIKWPKVYNNLYKVGESSGKFYVSRVTGTFASRHQSLGTTRSLHDALELIKADVGAGDVELDINDW